VKRLWTDSMRLMSFSWYGDHAWDAYSRSSLTCTLKALAMVAGSLERKHLCIGLALTLCVCKAMIKMSKHKRSF